MKAWISIASYLSKDILFRWLETPGALLARVLVALLLTALLLLAQATFLLAGSSLEHRIGRLGVRTLVVSEILPGDDFRATLGQSLAPLHTVADIVALRQLNLEATTGFNQSCTVLAYGKDTLPALAPLLAGNRSDEVILISNSVPPGIPTQVTIDDITWPARTATPPSWLERFPIIHDVVLVPDELAESWLQRGSLELAVVSGHPATPLRQLAGTIRTWLALDSRAGAQVQSPELLLDQLDELRSAQNRWQAGAGLIGGLAVALVFGSITILEYRQNRFIAALLRSFGSPRILLLLRYLLESVILVACAFLIARVSLSHFHPLIFARADFEPGLLDLKILNPYAWNLVRPAAIWLLLGALLSTLPVAFALRTPVGRVLQ